MVHSTPMEEREEEVNVTQTKLGYLLMDGRQVKIRSPRLRNKPLDQWQHEDRMEELNYMREGVARADRRAAQAEVELVQDTVMATLFAAWTRYETKLGHDDLTLGRFIEDMQIASPVGTIPPPPIPLVTELSNRFFGIYLGRGAWKKSIDQEGHYRILRKLTPNESAELDRQLDECFTHFRGATA